MVTFDGYDVELSRGDTLALKIELDGRDLPEGTDGVFTIKKRITSDEVVLQKRFDASDEELVVVLDADETNLAPGTYFWDVRLQIPMQEGGYEVYTPMEYAAFVVLPVVGVDIGTDGSNMVNPDLPVLQVVLAEAREVIAGTAAAKNDAVEALNTANDALETADETIARSEEALQNADTAIENANGAAQNADNAAELIRGLQVSAQSGETAGASVSTVDNVMTIKFVLPRGEQGERGPQGEPGERGLPGETGPAGYSPYIGPNGNWWYYDNAEGTYKDTGVYSGGEAPYIGENGNWFIGTEDSGVAAAGTEGVGIKSISLDEYSRMEITYTDGRSQSFSQSLKGNDGFSPAVSIMDVTHADGRVDHHITVTDRYGSESTTIKDGAQGPQGERGEAFTIAKVYGSVAEMNAGFATDGVGEGQFVVIETGDVDDAENARLYIKGAAAYEYVTDLSGAQGLQGPEGPRGIQGVQGEQGPAGANGISATHSWNGTTLTITSASGTSSANLKGDKGDKGDTGEQGPAGADGAKGDKGDTGLQGPAGYNPVRGTDYWTAADIAEIKGYVDSAILNGSW